MRCSRSRLVGLAATALVLVVPALPAVAAREAVAASAGEPAGPERGQLLWQEEFTPSHGSFDPDPASWVYDTGATGWGNGELQEYTDSRANSYVDSDGTLRIVTRRGLDGSGAPYTSARLLTYQKVAIGYGYLEARIKLPRWPASGLWPGFWMRSDDTVWPDGGEIDIMEAVNGAAGYSTAIHGGGESGHWQQYDWHSSSEVSDGEFHTYGVLFEPYELTFFHDGVAVHRVTPGGMPAGGVWPFADGHRWHVILNQAMGGAYPGEPDGTAALPAEMAVDYVRYWALPGADPGTGAGGDGSGDGSGGAGQSAPSGIPSSVVPSVAILDRMVSTTRVRLSRKQVRTPGRVKAKIRVIAGDGHATGRVRLRVGGKRIVANLKNSRAAILLPRRLRPGRWHVRVRYLGTASVLPSQATARLLVRR